MFLDEIKKMVDVADKDLNGAVDFDEFCKLTFLFPNLNVSEIMRSWQSFSSGFDLGEGVCTREDRAANAFGR